MPYSFGTALNNSAFDPRLSANFYGHVTGLWQTIAVFVWLVEIFHFSYDAVKNVF